MSLRARLLLATVALVAAGLLASDVATWLAVRSFLYTRIDQQLGDVAVRSAAMPPPPGDARLIRGPRGPGDLLLQFRDIDGNVLNQAPEPGELTLTDVVSGDDFRRLLDEGGGPITVTAPGSGDRWRVRAEAMPGYGVMFLAGAPLAEPERLLGRLVLIEALVTLVVVSALALLALRVVKAGLRPLDSMTETASAIAAGDLTRRVPASDHHEVGRLGSALNVMLGRIEAAFAARTASEDRLRRFVADASHELRTPLTSIRGYAELFRRGAAERPEDLALAMRRIEDEAERMGELVDELLLLTRLDQGRPLERVPVDLREVAIDAVGDAQVVEPERPITVEADAPVTVVGDEARLRQVAANLLANARMHTPAGTPVTVRVLADPDAPGFGGPGAGLLEVADEGPGLAREHAARVFERFYRTDPSRTRQRGGAGLGLSIVAAIADAHGGRASVRTDPGRGATFRVELPLVELPLLVAEGGGRVEPPGLVGGAEPGDDADQPADREGDPGRRPGHLGRLAGQ